MELVVMSGATTVASGCPKKVLIYRLLKNKKGPI